MTDQLIRYHHSADLCTWFVQPVGSQVPDWAVGVETCDSDESDYSLDEWLDDMAEISGVGYYDENGVWQWTKE